MQRSRNVPIHWARFAHESPEMATTVLSDEPIAPNERVTQIDFIRGLALGGVLLVNLLGDFRIPLSAHILGRDEPLGPGGALVTELSRSLIEFKAFMLFSFLFGVGVAMQAGRASKQQRSWFLVRRFGVLLAIGVIHMVMIWNGDILALYAICGLMLTPLLSLPEPALVVLGLCLLAWPNLGPFPVHFPTPGTLKALTTEALHAYRDGTWLQLFTFRLRETRLLIMPLLVLSLPRTLGLMLLGIAAWRKGWMVNSPRLWRQSAVLGVAIAFAGQRLGSEESVALGLTLLYAAVLLLWNPRARYIAAAGRMALTNYLSQSVIFGFIFYSYGLGWFGRVGLVATLLGGLAVYCMQLVISQWWLQRFHFGPCEWLWRSFSYLKWQPFARRPYHGRMCRAAWWLAAACAFPITAAPAFHPKIPKTWDEAKISTVEIALAHPNYSPKHMTGEFYYRMPVRPIYKSYPVYHPDREPTGYLNWLAQREPVLIWNSSNFRTQQDWIEAGKMVFESPIGYGAIGMGQEHSQELFVHNRSWYERVRPPLSSNGELPFVRYVIREKGKVEIGMGACALCHSRVLPDGSVLEGGPGNFPFDAAFADTVKTEPQAVAENRTLMEALYWKPWAPLELLSRLKPLDPASLAELFSGRPLGVMTRHRLSLDTPVQIPDLIGVRDRAYLDHTGLQLHRDTGDLMRYAALNQGGDDFANFGGFMPMDHLLNGQKLTPESGDRYSDEQLYAMTLYVYSLRPPSNPHHANEQTRVGGRIFLRQGCGHCHPAPLYTNNKLTPAVGFRVPNDHRRRYNIMPVVVGTDPAATMDTRRGTGYYKVPSLLGLWYRTPLGHSGWVSTLDEWFDSKRLQDDYVPTGFVPSGQSHSAVKGHEFGLNLSQEDKAAMIAFLKTL